MSQSQAQRQRKKQEREGKPNPEMYRRDWNGIHPVTKTTPSLTGSREKQVNKHRKSRSYVPHEHYSDFYYGRFAANALA